MISDQNVVGSNPSEVISSAGVLLANDFSVNGFSFNKTLKLPIWCYLAGLFLEVVFTGYHNGGLYSGPPKGATTCVSVIVMAIGVMLQNGTRGNASHVQPQFSLRMSGNIVNSNGTLETERPQIFWLIPLLSGGMNSDFPPILTELVWDIIINYFFLHWFAKATWKFC